MTKFKKPFIIICGNPGGPGYYKNLKEMISINYDVEIRTHLGHFETDTVIYNLEDQLKYHLSAINSRWENDKIPLTLLGHSRGVCCSIYS